MSIETKGGFESAREAAENDKSLQIAMALKRYARQRPNTSIGDAVYVSSRDIQSAIEGDGIEISVDADIDREGFSRIDAKVGSVGFDESLEITKIGEDRFLVKIKS